MDLILFAIPFFIALIAIELVTDKLKGVNNYTFSDTVTSLSTGVLSQLLKIVQLIVPLNIYVLFESNFALMEWPVNAFTWVIAFVLYDFCYYWLHRCGHEIWILWAAHVVHHSSEEYNLSTALRQTSSSVFSVIFYLPMALLGFDPLMVLTVGALNLIYQFWVHTQHIGKLGWAEQFFITPSNHRGHHAQNDIYIDRNYGGVFIIWDKMFGSYQEELESDPPVFGIRGALKSWNPVEANLQIYKMLWRDCRQTKNWWYKLTIWFRRTGWRPPDLIDQTADLKGNLADFQKYHTRLSPWVKSYAAIQYLLHTALSFFLLLNYQSMSLVTQLISLSIIILGSFSMGQILDRAKSPLILEFVKYTLLVYYALNVFNSEFYDLTVYTSLSLSLTLLVLFRGYETVFSPENK